jgi:isopentenyl-diphosphate delta-isomerase
MISDIQLDPVVLVDEDDRELGTLPKRLVHSKNTPLHRGLSVFIFDNTGRVIVQQRAFSKKTWPGVWSNSCCGHPLPGETYEQAAIRKVREELGIEVKGLEKVADYRYRFERDGVVEHEICPIFVAFVDGDVEPDPLEVHDWKWIAWEVWMHLLDEDKLGSEGEWSEWCKEEVVLVDQWRRNSPLTLMGASSRIPFA